MQLNEDGHSAAFIFLIAILAFERLVMVIIAVCKMFFQRKYKNIPACLIGNLLGCDITLGYKIVEYNDLCYSSKKF